MKHHQFKLLGTVRDDNWMMYEWECSRCGHFWHWPRNAVRDSMLGDRDVQFRMSEWEIDCHRKSRPLESDLVDVFKREVEKFLREFDRRERQRRYESIMMDESRTTYTYPPIVKLPETQKSWWRRLRRSRK